MYFHNCFPIEKQIRNIQSVIITFYLSLKCDVSLSYGRVYTADPYHAALAPAAYGVGAMVGFQLSLAE